jgi:hypothetical protein
MARRLLPVRDTDIVTFILHPTRSTRYPQVHADTGTLTHGIRYLRPSDADKNRTAAWGSTLASMATKTTGFRVYHAYSLADTAPSRTTKLFLFFI